jgi:hypothetical protein
MWILVAECRAVVFSAVAWLVQESPVGEGGSESSRQKGRHVGVLNKRRKVLVLVFW